MPSWAIKTNDTGALGLRWHEAPLLDPPWDPYLIWMDLSGIVNAFDDINAPQPGAQSQTNALVLPTLLVELDDLFTFRGFLNDIAQPNAPPAKALLTTHSGWLNAFDERERKGFAVLQLTGRWQLAQLIREFAMGRAGVARAELSAPRQPRLGLGTALDMASPLALHWRLFEASTTPNISSPLEVLVQKGLTLNAGLNNWFTQVGSKPSRSLARRAGVRVGVIDDRCNFAAYPPGTVDVLWDQDLPRRPRSGVVTDDSEAPPNGARGRSASPNTADEGFQEARIVQLATSPSQPSDFRGAAYGRVLPVERENYDQGPPDQRLKPECDRYREHDYFHPLRQWSHGAAVLHLVAAKRLWIGRNAVTVHGGPSRIQFVQLATGTVLDTGGGSLASHALDGVLDIVQRAPDNHDIVVNLSFGTHGGPHDGTTMFERALLALLNHYDGTGQDGKRLHVVVPAGNTHLWRCHSTGWLAEPGDAHTLHWRVFPDNPDPSFVEVWISAPDAVVLEVTPPGEETATVKAPEHLSWQRRADDGLVEVMGAVVFGRAVVQGQRGSMALVAAGPTNPEVYQQASAAKRADAVRSKDNKGDGDRLPGRAPPGVWKIVVRRRADSTSPVQVDAWVQRADSAPARSRDEHGFDDRQSQFVDLGTEEIDPTFTLNGIATCWHERFFVVGAARESDGGVSIYSAAGPALHQPRRAEGPDCLEEVDFSCNLPGQLVGGALSSSRRRVSGTSMAAAIFTRRLHDHLKLHGGAAGVLPMPAPFAQTRDPPRTAADPRRAGPDFRGDCYRMPRRTRDSFKR